MRQIGVSGVVVTRREFMAEEGSDAPGQMHLHLMAGSLFEPSRSSNAAFAR